MIHINQQLGFPGWVSAKGFERTATAMTAYDRLKTMTLEEGLEFINRKPPTRKIDGFWVENPLAASSVRLRMFQRGMISCIECGLKGTVFYVERHKNDKVMPYSINLYGRKGMREVMMTWDHILPKSLGGSNNLENAQCMCADCNSRKGNILSLAQLIELATHDDPNRIHKFKNVPIRGPLTQTIFKTINDVRHEMKEVFRFHELTLEQRERRREARKRRKVEKKAKLIKANRYEVSDGS